MLHTMSTCWYYHICFIFCYFLPLNPTVVPTAAVRLLSQLGMGHCCLYHGCMIINRFILLTELSSCVPGSINYNKEDMTIISRVTQYDDYQSSDILLSVWGCDNFDRRGERGNKEQWYCGLCIN